MQKFHRHSSSCINIQRQSTTLKNSEGGERVLCRSNPVEPVLQCQQLFLEAPGKFTWHEKMILKARNQGYFTMRLFHKLLHDVFEGWGM